MASETNTQPNGPSESDPPWFVFKSIAADGSWSVGIARGTPDSSAVIVIAEGLSRARAVTIARAESIKV